MKGVQKRLFLYNIFISRLVYLNASYCGIEKILSLKIKYNITSFIIITSFVNNKLTGVVFLSTTIFKNVVFLDLSFNRSSIFISEPSSALKKLLVLILRGNPLIRIGLDQAPPHSMLSLIDLQHIYLYLNLYIVFSKDLVNQIEVKVSDASMCCILDKDVHCTSNENAKICIGLFGSGWPGKIFYSLSIITFSISLIINIANIMQIMKLMAVHNRKKIFGLFV